MERQRPRFKQSLDTQILPGFIPWWKEQIRPKHERLPLEIPAGRAYLPQDEQEYERPEAGTLMIDPEEDPYTFTF